MDSWSFFYFALFTLSNSKNILMASNTAKTVKKVFIT